MSMLVRGVRKYSQRSNRPLHILLRQVSAWLVSAFVRCVFVNNFLYSFISTLIMLPFTCIAFLLLAFFYCIVTSILLMFKLCTSGGRTRTETRRGTRPDAGGQHIATSEQGQEAQAGNDSSGERNTSTDLNSSDVLREIAAIFAMSAEEINEEAIADKENLETAVAPQSTS